MIPKAGVDSMRGFVVVCAVLFVACAESRGDDELERPAAGESSGTGVAGAAAPLAGSVALEAGTAAPTTAGTGDEAGTVAEPPTEAGTGGSAGEAGSAAGAGGAPLAGSGGTVSAGTGGTSGSPSSGTGGSSGTASAGTAGTAGTVAPAPQCQCTTLVRGQTAFIVPLDWCRARVDDPPNASGYSGTKTTGCRDVLEAQAQGVDAVREHCCESL
jgi:hypothetical protein